MPRHTECTIDTATSVVETAARGRLAHRGRVLRLLHAVVNLALMAPVALVALADLLLGDVLALIGQVVRVCVLGCDLLNRVPEFRRVHAQHALIDLVFEHEATVFLVDQLFHPRGPQALVSKRRIFFTLLGFLKLDLLLGRLGYRLGLLFLAFHHLGSDTGASHRTPAHA